MAKSMMWDDGQSWREVYGGRRFIGDEWILDSFSRAFTGPVKTLCT